MNEIRRRPVKARVNKLSTGLNQLSLIAISTWPINCSAIDKETSFCEVLIGSFHQIGPANWVRPFSFEGGQGGN